MEFVGALAALVLGSIPLGITGWAFLDAASRPEWAWALAGRRRIVWMGVIVAGLITVIGGLVISGYYLTQVRRDLRWAEDGRIDDLERRRGARRVGDA